MRPSTTDRDTITRVSRLSFRARRIIEGLRSGAHRSPYYGSSVEFAEHKEYTAGDDLRFIDWKLFGKSDRYYVKRFEEETNLVAWLLVDQSASMTYRSSGLPPLDIPWWQRLTRRVVRPPPSPEQVSDFGPHVPPGSKLAQASLLAACLGYLLVEQGDQVGLSTFGGGGQVVIPPRARPGHVQALMTALVDAPQPGKADLDRALANFSPRLDQRGVVFVLSDLLEDSDRVFKAVKLLRTRRNDVILFHVLDNDELTFPFTDVARFQDPEDRSQELLTEPREIRDAYLEELHTWLGQVRQRCRELEVDYVLVNTSDSLEDVLREHLMARRRGRSR